jgi:hypothetical protein
MKSRIVNGFFLSIYLVFLSACSSVDYARMANYTPISTAPCNEKASKIHLFFQGENIDFAYEKLGLIELDESFFRSTEVYDVLKKTAWNHCANGIINLHEENRSVYNSSTKEYENVKSYKGIAVKIDTNSTFYQKHKNEHDLVFIDGVNNTNERIKETSNVKLVFGLIAVGAGGLLLLSMKN